MNPGCKIVVAAVALVAILPFAESARCQVKTSPGKAASSTKKPPEDRTHWKFFIDTLIVEARLVDPEQERPLVMAEVADAYWLIDQQQAKRLFTEAFDTALAVKPDPPVAEVLSRVAKRDRALATELTKRLLAAHSEAMDSAANALRTARELLKTDPRFAIELAKMSASLGPSMDGLSFLFQVAQTEPAGAAEIYDAYLRSLMRRGDSDLSSILWLAGYPLGYGEAYGGSNDPAMLYGFSGMLVPGLKPQPQLAAVYLQLAFAAITNTLKQAAGAGNADREVLNALALFSTSYLFPEVQRYLPNAEPAWSSLYRQALAGTTESRRTVVEQRLRFITETRVRTGEQSADEAARNDMQDIEKLPDACSRDRAYAQAALAHSHAKDFREARKVADRIENLEQRDAVLQFAYYDEAVSLIDSGDLIRSLESVEKVTAKEQRAVLYVRVANAALKKSDKATVLDVLNRARSLVRDADDPELQAGVLLSVGAVYVRFDPSEATYVTRESIKAVNRMKERVDETFSVVRQVGLSCVGDIRLQLSRERVEAFSFYETLGAIAKSDAQAEGALALTSEIQDKATRIRAQLAIVKAVIK